MSEREKWMPDLVDEVFKAHTDLYNGHGESTQAMLYRTGLRAQVAVLEELIAHMRARYTSEANPTGSYCNEESLWIAEKIEEIRREIG